MRILLFPVKERCLASLPKLMFRFLLLRLTFSQSHPADHAVRSKPTEPVCLRQATVSEKCNLTNVRILLFPVKERCLASLPKLMFRFLLLRLTFSQSHPAEHSDLNQLSLSASGRLQSLKNIIYPI